MTHIAVDDQVVIGTVQRAAAGDEAAFSLLVVTHQQAMSRVAYVICGDADATRDAVQNAWSIAWQRLQSLRDPEQVGPWLIAIAANQARQGLRMVRRRRVVDVSDSMDPERRGDPADEIGLVDLHRALARLSPDDRRLIALRYVAGFDSTEIAAQIGGSPSGIRSRLARVLGRLRTEIDHD